MGDRGGTGYLNDPPKQEGKHRAEAGTAAAAKGGGGGPAKRVRAKAGAAGGARPRPAPRCSALLGERARRGRAGDGGRQSTLLGARAVGVKAPPKGPFPPSSWGEFRGGLGEV